MQTPQHIRRKAAVPSRRRPAGSFDFGSRVGFNVHHPRSCLASSALAFRS